jgi:hypothetical protein
VLPLTPISESLFWRFWTEADVIVLVPHDLFPKLAGPLNARPLHRPFLHATPDETYFARRPACRQPRFTAWLFKVPEHRFLPLFDCGGVLVAQTKTTGTHGRRLL